MHPQYQELDEYKNRLRKLEEIEELGINPYPHQFKDSVSIEYIDALFNEKNPGDYDDALEGRSESFITSGRLVLFRAMGKNAFGHIQGQTKRLQVLFNRDATVVAGLSPETPALKFIEKKIDLGDIIGVRGNLFRTQKNELTLFVKQLFLLSKSLLPLPEKHSGLIDKELRYRKRWLDLISHEEIKETFIQRSLILKEIRDFLHEQHFLEVETPILQNIYGGAEARPFSTHIHALNSALFLRISLEISLKKILIGGMDRIFEIGKVFRNEGLDKTHNPEFTMLEAYATNWDYENMMIFVEKLVERLAIKLHNSTKIEMNGITLELKAPWIRMTMKESIEQYAGLKVDLLTEDNMREILRNKTDVDRKLIASSSKGLLIALLFDEFVSDKLMQPHHITDHPIETTPLCKPHRLQQQKQEGLVERFESFVLGKELCNAYSELNHPLLQRKLLEEQSQKREAGNEEAHPLDEEFLEAICQGMPPAGGVGIGIDRLVMILTNNPSIRDVLYFPIMKTQVTS